MMMNYTAVPNLGTCVKSKEKVSPMPNIKAISDLKNYSSIVNEVSYGNRVYLTKNGHGICALIDLKELEELDQLKSQLQVMTKLAEARVSIRDNDTMELSGDPVEIFREIRSRTASTPMSDEEIISFVKSARKEKPDTAEKR